MVRALISLQDRCQNYKITDERYQSESSALINAGFSQKQANRLILRPYSRNIVAAVLASHSILKTRPYNLSCTQIIKIASNSGGGLTIQQIIQSYSSLLDLGLEQHQIVKIAAHSGGKNAIEQVLLSYNTLINLGYNQQQIIEIASNRCGGRVIEQIIDSYQKSLNLIENNQYTSEQPLNETTEQMHPAELRSNPMRNNEDAQSNIDSLLQEFLMDSFMNEEITDNNIHSHERTWENTSISSNFSIFSNKRNYPKEKENHYPEKRQKI